MKWLIASTLGFVFSITLAIDFACASNVYLFADDEHVAVNDGLARTVLPATKLPQPVIRGDKPWQQNPYTYGTVIYDEEQGIYKAWYQSINSGVPVRTPLLYNVSKDGRNWNPPNVGLVECNGSTENNILLKIGHLYSPSVIKDDQEKDPAKKYKLAYWDIGPGGTYGGKGGMYIAFSPDGVHWTPQEGGPVLVARQETGSVSDVLDVMRDPHSGKYLLHAKTWRWNGTKPAYRMINRSESEDFETWTEPQVILDTRAEDPDQPQTYGMPVFEYAGQYWGLLRIYHSPGNEKIEIELAHSRNDTDYKRVVPGEPILPCGEEGTWDDGMVFTCMPIDRGETFEIFYGGWDGPHNARNRRAAIGLATLPAGRLVALTPKSEKGVMLTEPIELSGGRLAINADAGSGTIRAALLTEAESAITGFSLADSVAFEGDELRQVLQWKNEKFSALPDSVCLRLELTGDAKLYELRRLPTLRNAR